MPPPSRPAIRHRACARGLGARIRPRSRGRGTAAIILGSCEKDISRKREEQFQQKKAARIFAAAISRGTGCVSAARVYPYRKCNLVTRKRLAAALRQIAAPLRLPTSRLRDEADFKHHPAPAPGL